MPELGSGTRLGPYEISEQIGAGGMGEVYRATDTRLKRQVALKVLPAPVTCDPDRLARFEREAEVLASLNHPNIAALYGVEESGSTKALVMELVDGPTLADRIAQGPMPIGEVLSIARQIAVALAAAHEQGIIHRDLKPANIKVRSGDEVKVLDFGLAKAMERGASFGDPTSPQTMAPTIASPAHMTSAGVILGTVAYMSPEQASGKNVDRRTDLWAFGVVLFEMLTGRPLFAGESTSHVIAAILKDEPDWTAVPADVPAGVKKLLRRCLDKDRRKRLSDAATAALECEEAAASPTDADVPTVSIPPASSISAWSLPLGFLAASVIAAAIAWRMWPPPVPVQPSIRFAIDLPEEQSFTRAGRHVLALSPDGTLVVYVANQRLFLHDLRDLTTRVIEGTEQADPSEPVFSPDGAWIAYWSSGALKKIPTSGGVSVPLAAIDNPFGLSWAADQILVGQAQSIVQVPANGGPRKTLVAIETVGEWIQSPHLIDEGRAVLFTLRTDGRDWNRSSIIAQDLASGTRTTLVEGGTDGRPLPGGVLIYAQGSALFAVALDERRRSTAGPTVPLERDVLPSVGGFSGASQVSWSASGSLAYAVDYSAAESSLIWMTRDGKVEPTPLPARQQHSSPASLSLSPDGRRVAIRLVGASRAQTDVWIGDVARGMFTRLTSSGTATDPVWTPDGARVCYRDNPFDVLCQPFDGSAPPETLFQVNRLSTIGGFSRDNEWVLLSISGQNGGQDLWAGANRPPFDMAPVLATAANETVGELSPDGRWIVYRSDESGRGEIYVRPFPNVQQGRWQVSTSGATAPRWSSDGRELYFLATGSGGAEPQYTLTAVPVTTRPSFSTGAPIALGQVPSSSGYDVAADGRILMSVPASTPTAGRSRQRIVVVQRWTDDLKSKMGTSGRLAGQTPS